jgi:diadenosine tetraphosphate (Ap4A) HIT family hydrolase
MAPVNFLIVPKMHISSAGAMTKAQRVVAHIFEVIAKLAKE